MSGHTPGPWRVGSLPSYNAGTGEPEAFVYRLGSDNPEETAHNRICVRGSASMDCDADARMIAAAPDLLDALRDMLALGYQEGWDVATTSRQLLMRNALEAIRKAEGR